jgi:hypothetical protein
MKIKKFSVLAFIAIILSMNAVFPQEGVKDLKVIPHIDLGYLGVISHYYRVGTEADGNTMFNFVSQGGQDILFPYQRLSIDAILWDRHHVTFLYQPLTVSTRTIAGKNGTGKVQIDGVDFGTKPINITYGFDFYRVSYYFDFVANGITEICAGVSFQLRDANIVFESDDGAQRTVQNNVGLVPILKFKAGHWIAPWWGVELDADGFYASSAIFNGSGRPFEGWIWDAAFSLKAKIFERITSYLTFRSIGGGANGSSAYDNVSATTSSQKATYNALATFSVTLGFSYEFSK